MHTVTTTTPSSLPNAFNFYIHLGTLDFWTCVSPWQINNNICSIWYKFPFLPALWVEVIHMQPGSHWWAEESVNTVVWPEADWSFKLHPERPERAQSLSSVSRFHSISKADRWAAGAPRRQTPSASRRQKKHTKDDSTLTKPHWL